MACIFIFFSLIAAVNDFRKPIIKTPLKDMQSPKNADLQLALVMTADPLPDITWTKDGKKMSDADKEAQLKREVKELEHGLKEIRYFVHLSSARHCDTGNYEFKAKNKYGEAESSCRLDILLKPEIEGFKDQISVPNMSVTFEVNVYANPKPKVIWTKGGQNLCSNDNCEVIADAEREVYT